MTFSLEFWQLYGQVLDQSKLVPTAPNKFQGNVVGVKEKGKASLRVRVYNSLIIYVAGQKFSFILLEPALFANKNQNQSEADYVTQYSILVYTEYASGIYHTSEWCSEVISQVLFTSGQPKKKNGFPFQIKLLLNK